jgi:hypothetical protein
MKKVLARYAWFTLTVAFMAKLSGFANLIFTAL